jgi:hypothetical protein
MRFTRRFPRTLIGCAFLLYGGLRLFVGLGLVGQSLGLLDIAAFNEPLADVASFLTEKADRTLVPVSPLGYVAYIALMGLVLSAGAIGVVRNRGLGLRLIGVFLALYVGLFVNFLTINRKVSHLAVCSILFLVLVWLDRLPARASPVSDV